MDKRLRYFNSSLKECSKKTKIAVVGEKTSKTLDDFGIKADFIPPEFVAESLIDNMRNEKNISKEKLEYVNNIDVYIADIRKTYEKTL